MGVYEEALRTLNPAQRKAVETIDGPVLVIAGPGTGKTQLLTTRIAHILAKTDTRPENILCLTFTESAAQTMQERLTNMIGQGAYNVTISTYHAFGSDIIRRYPEYFADEAELQPADDLTIDRLFRQIVASLPYSNPLKYSDAYLGDIKTLVSDAKRALLTPQDLRTTATQNLTYIQSVNPTIRRTLDGLARIDKKAIPLFAKLHTTLAERFDSVIRETQPKRSRKLADETTGSADDFTRVSGLSEDTVEKATPARALATFPGGADGTQPLAEQFLGSLKEAVEQAEESGKTASLTAWKNTWLAKDENGQFIMDGIRTNQKLHAAAEVYEQYLITLKAQGLFDYDDMILRAVHALTVSAELRFTLQEQYQYILLDEFQDTNEAQLRLVELLTDNPVNEGRPNILAVGDDDQAIYAFQGANYSHMLKFNDLYRDVTVVPLTENYRSHPDVLHLAQGIAGQIEERLHHHFPAIDKTLTPAAKDLPKEGVVERRDAQSDVMHYAWVTKRIQELLEQGVEPSEIAVLAPKHRHLEPLVPFLLQETIPVRYEKRENVLDDPAINQLLRMAELTLALANGDHPTANALWPQVLSFGFWELPTSRIWQLSWQTTDDRQDWTTELLKDDALKPIALFFIRLSQLAGAETLETMVDYLIGTQPLNLNEPGLTTYKSPYYDHYFSELSEDVTEKLNADFWSLLTNLIVLRARLREYRGSSEERLTLQDLLEFVRAHRVAELKILNTNPYATSTEAVQLMTAYKAKGMEFKAVFVLAVHDEAWGSKARTQSTRIPLPPNLTHIRYAGVTEDERLRLFYVAITRAKYQLHLVNFLQTYAGKTTTRLKYLQETANDQVEVLSPLLPAASQKVQPAEDGVPEPTTELAAYWRERHETALKRADTQALLKDRLKTFQLSATHISDFVDFVHCGPQSFFMRTILRFPQAPRPELQFGNAMHEALEWIHHQFKQAGKVPATAAVHKAFARRLEAKRMSEHDYQLFLERGKEALAAYLAQRADSFSPEHVVEYNFRHEGVFIGDAHLGGKIDKLIINKQTKEITIVDYKTGRSHNKWTRDTHLHKNRQQLYFYKALVEGSRTFAGYKVTDAYLEFVEPNEHGKIQDLHLQFDQTEFDHTRKLAEAIWHHIMRLDLPNTDDYPHDLKGIEAFEADLVKTL